MKGLFYGIVFILMLTAFTGIFPGNAAAATLSLPPRPADAPGGAAFVTQISNLSLTDRENTIMNQILSGNIPDFMRTLSPVTVTATIAGTPYSLTYHVIPDYLAVGSNTDYFLCPMTPLLAQKIADHTNCILPTRKMVNDIWSAATVKMAPQPIAPSPEMTTVPVFNQHNTLVGTQRATFLTAHPLGALVGGDKKDVAITIRLVTQPGRVAIYGWHYQNGDPIQPLSLVHEETYADYSHGIRLVLRAATLNSQPADLDTLLKDPVLNVLVSDEGALTQTRYNVPQPIEFPYQDAFPASGRELTAWQDRFTAPVIQSFTPASPGGDGYVLRVMDASGGAETTRIGNLTDDDYFVQCDIYCQYRPELASNGYERVGIFLRDNGNGVFEHTYAGGGYCYAMAWDSADGRLWCMKSVAGVITDLSPAPIYRTSTAWRRMRIEARGNQLTFLCDGETLLNTTDDTFSAGQCGIGYHEYFTTNSNMAGTRADNFLADCLSVNPTPTATPGPSPTATPVGTITPTPTPAPDNPVCNGGFEEEFVGGIGTCWSKWEAAGSNPVAFGKATLNKHGGEQSQYWSRSDTQPFLGGLYQRITVIPGRRYRIRAWLKSQSAMAGTVMAFGYDPQGGADGESAAILYADLSGAALNTWVEYDVTATATGPTLTLFSKAGHTGTFGGTNSYFYMDDVSVEVIPQDSSSGSALLLSRADVKKKLSHWDTLTTLTAPMRPWGPFGERVREYLYPPDVRIHINTSLAEGEIPTSPVRLLIFSLPNGNTIEQTIGKALREGVDWHFGIQHIGAQTRLLRDRLRHTCFITAYAEARQRSWPLWRREHEDSGGNIPAIVGSIREQCGAEKPRITLSGHSGGGSFIFGFVNTCEEIPDEVDRIAFLDANYGYSDKDGHGDKLVRWLKKNRNVLCVICYDDRSVTYQGKPIVSETGGTWRRTEDMVKRLRRDFPLTETREGDVIRYRGLDGRIDILMHTNPDRKILHTVLVGDMGGFVHAMTTGTPDEGRVAVFGGPALWSRWIQPE